MPGAIPLGAAVVKGRRLWGVAGLCILSGSGWILTQAYPSEVPWPFPGCLHFLLIAVVGAVVAATRGELKRLSLRRAALVCAAGVGLFALPVAVLQFAAGKVPEFTSVAVFCAVPLMTVLALMASDAGGESTRLRGLMVPGVLGLAGALFLFPLENPGSLRRWLFLGAVLACAFMVSVSSVWLHSLLQGVGVAAAVAVIGLGSAAALAVSGSSAAWAATGWKAAGVEALRGAVLDLPEVWLLAWLMREISPVRLSARFVLAPAVTVLEGCALERSGLDVREVAALGFLLGGGAMLLVRDEPEELPGLGLG